MLQDNENESGVDVGIAVEPDNQLTDDQKEELIKKVRLMVQNEFLSEFDGYIRKGQLELALRRLNQAKDQGLNESTYQTYKAGIHSQRDEVDQQWACLKKAVRFCKDDPENKAMLYSQLSYFQFNQNDKIKARYYARRALEIYQDEVEKSDLQAALSISYRLVDAGLTHEAVDLLEPIYKDGKDTMIRYALAHCYYYNKQYSDVLDITAGLLYSKVPDYDQIIKQSCRALGLKRREVKHRYDMQFFYDCEVRDFYTDYASQTPSQSPISANGMTVDLKPMDDGSIRILELNYLPASGLNAYGHLYKRSLDDVIHQDYRRFNNKFYEANVLVEKPYPYLSHQFTGMGVPQFLTHMVLQTFYDDPIMVNASLNALTAQSYKDDFVLNCQNLGLNGFIPPSLVVGKDDNVETIQNCLSTMNGDCFVLKTSNDARGEGVEIVSREKLNDAIDHIVTGQKWAGFSNPETWQNDYHPNFVIQECVQSKPCRAADGEHYDGTMRVALTHVFNHEKGLGELMIHGMFWKLPREPISQKHGRDTIMSLATNARIKRGRPFAARVQPKRQQMVRDHLVDFFDKFGPYMAQHNDDVISHKIQVAQSDRRDTMSNLVREQLVSHPYGNTMPIMSNHIPEAVQYFGRVATGQIGSDMEYGSYSPFRSFSRASKFRP
jgi:tetratricopeptide (TPR) repeat protein